MKIIPLFGIASPWLLSTIQAFDSCTSRPDVCANAWSYIHPWIKCQNNKPSTPMTHVAGESKLHSIVRSGTSGGINCQETGRQLGVWLCIMSRLPTYLVQELSVGTVLTQYYMLNAYCMLEFNFSCYLFLFIYSTICSELFQFIFCICNFMSIWCGQRTIQYNTILTVAH